MVGRFSLPGFDGLEVPAFFDTGDAAALARWKREHPDWFEAGRWMPGRGGRGDGSATGERIGRGAMPPMPGGVAGWERAAATPLDPAGLSLADFQRVKAAARAGVSASDAGPSLPRSPPAAAVEPDHGRIWWWLHRRGLIQTRHEKAEMLRRSMGSASGSIFMLDGKLVDVDAMSDDEVIAFEKEARDTKLTPWSAGVIAPTMGSGGGTTHLPTSLRSMS